MDAAAAVAWNFRCCPTRIPGRDLSSSTSTRLGGPFQHISFVAVSSRKDCVRNFNPSHGHNSGTLSWRNAAFVGEANLFYPIFQFNEMPGFQRRQVCATALTNNQVSLVKTAWDILKKDAERHGLSLFLKVFEIAPSTKRLFSFLQDSDVPLAKNPHLKSHALLVFRLTCEAAVSLGNKGEVKTPGSTMRDMGIAHVKSNVVDEHFDVLRYALLETVEEGLPAGLWTEEMKEAWGEAYDELTKAIKSEMKSEAATIAAGVGAFIK